MSSTRTHATTWAKPTRAGRTDGECPFRVEFRLGPYRLAHAALDVDVVDLGDVVISGDDVDLSARIRSQTFLRSVPDRLESRLVELEDDAIVYPFYRYDRCWVATEGDFDAYLASFSKTSRKGLKRRNRQLVAASGGALDIRRFATGDAMAAYHADARAISAKTFQEKLMDDGLPADDDFCREMVRQADGDRCYGSILYLDDEPVSYLHCERQGTGWIAVYGGFDPAHAKLSPGTVHLLAELETAFDDPNCDVFDFGAGHCDYKPFFATHAVPSADVLVLDRTARNHLIVSTHKTLVTLTACGVALADKLRLKTLLRQKIRGR